MHPVSNATLHPLHIGSVTIDTPIILAPMAGVTDLPFRLLCKQMGAGLLCMEMVSAKAIHYKNKNTESLMAIDERELPVSLQLFGSEPELMAEVAHSIEERPFALLDLNMGCPVPKVVNNGEGSALMKDPKLAAEIVRAISSAIQKPVTVKIRKGFDDAHVNAVELAKRLEDAGAAAIAVHGRTREQYYSGKADWDIIRQVKEAVAIPVIANGDIDSPEAAERCIEETGADAIMIGRGAQGNPWIFREIKHYLECGEKLPRPDADEIKTVLRQHAQLQMEVKGEYIGMREMRKHAAWYLAGFPHAARLRKQACEMEKLEDLEHLIDMIEG
ncbi:MAG: tRNA dihydrouridine synthase DusB [Lachnospiraceae bacterium]|nr:tRNA dihydrouridine synthase DusB [Lachnospiraceae bacterium]